MRKLLLIWGLPVVIYAGFWAWYTNLGGPISPAEAETYLAYFETRDVDAVRLAQLQRFMAEDDGGDFVMLNLLDLKSEAAGADLATNPAFSGAHVYKIAALDKTIAVPVHDGLPLADPRVLLFFVLMSLAGLLNAFVRR